MKFIKVLFALLLYLHCEINKCNTEKIAYISTEHPTVEWVDPKYFKNLTLYTRRHSRKDPRYYVGLYVHTLFKITNSLQMDFYFYQFLTNRYRPSFVEIHYGFCDMLQFDVIFGPPIKKALGGKDCPYPPGIYDMQNMTIPYVPKGFPFTKGRIYCNISVFEDGSLKLLVNGFIDMEIKVARI